MEVTINRVRYRWAESAGFALNRPQGVQEYILLHFLSPVELAFCGDTVRVDKGAFIVFFPRNAAWLRGSGNALTRLDAYYR